MVGAFAKVLQSHARFVSESKVEVHDPTSRRTDDALLDVLAELVPRTRCKEEIF